MSPNTAVGGLFNIKRCVESSARCASGGDCLINPVVQINLFFEVMYCVVASPLSSVLVSESYLKSDRGRDSVSV